MTTSSLKVPVLVGLLVVLLVTGSSPLTAVASNPAPATAEDYPTARTLDGPGIMSAPGTAWVPERRNKFSLWRPVGWGTQARVKLAGVGDQWVHIPIPYSPWLAGTTTYAFHVTFCAQSSNGAQTRPTRVDVWDDDTRIFTAPVNWRADNSRQCWAGEFPRRLASSVSISVLLHFANTTDQLTLMHAQVSFVPEGW